MHELTTRLLDILPCHFSVHNQLFYSFKFCFEKEKKKKKTKKLINKRNCQLVEFKIQCTSIDIQYKSKFRVSNLLYRWELTLCTASRFIIETEGKKKEKEKEQRTKESIKSIPFKRRFTHLTDDGDTKRRLQRRWNSISLTRHPLKFHPDQRDHIFESIYIPLREQIFMRICIYIYVCVCVYMYIKYRPPRLEKVFSAVKSANAYTWHLEKRGPILSQYFHNFSTSLYLRPILGFTAYGIIRQRRYVIVIHRVFIC